ncbi:MAG: IPTL-CTERM sorting domain-containing protein [Thermodesulfobacteriota bacterium]
MLKNKWVIISTCFIVLFCCSLIVNAETPTIVTDAEPLNRNRNLVINGSFEEPHLDNGSTFDGFLPGVDGDGYYFLSPITVEIPIAQPDGWTTSGGGMLTYARWGNNINALPSAGLPVAGQAWSSTEIHGERSVYLGNFTPQEVSETPEYMPNGEVVFSSPPTITLRPEYGPNPFGISQNVTGLVPGGIYRISFWVSGEWSNLGFASSPNGATAGDGIVGVKIESYDLLYLAIPAGNSAEPVGAPHVFGTEEFHVYTLEFEATDTDMDISFLNWGHFDSTDGTIGWTRGQTTELIMDDVIINAVRLPTNVPTLSEWGLISMAAILGIVGFMVMRRKKVAA